jgi:hypothetical protein
LQEGIVTVTDDIKSELAYLRAQLAPLTSLLDKLESARIIEFGTAYQDWYTRAVKIIGSIAPDRLVEFTGYYRIDPKRKSLNAMTYVIQDFVNGYGPTADAFDKKPFDELNLTQVRVVNQVQILSSIQSRLGSVLADVRGSLLAELEDRELEASRQLISVNERAAGALAGVVLERHLQRVAENHQVNLRKRNPTIADINDPLKEAGVIGIPMWRKIQYLSDIRNLCSHQKAQAPTVAQVTELIDGVNAIIKSVF